MGIAMSASGSITAVQSMIGERQVCPKGRLLRDLEELPLSRAATEAFYDRRCR
jgi:hypothetical protein